MWKPLDLHIWIRVCIYSYSFKKYFSNKTYVVGTQKNRLKEAMVLRKEAVVLSTRTNVKTDG